MKGNFFSHTKAGVTRWHKLPLIAAGAALWLFSSLSLPSAQAQLGQSELIQPDNNWVPPDTSLSPQSPSPQQGQYEQTGQSDWIRPSPAANPTSNYNPSELSQSGWIQPNQNSPPYQPFTQPQQPASTRQSGWIHPGQQPPPMQQSQSNPDFSSFDARYGNSQLNGEISRMRPQQPPNQQTFLPSGSPDLMQDTSFDAIGQALNKAAQSGAIPQAGTTGNGNMQGGNQFSRPILSHPNNYQRPGLMQSYPARMVGNSVNRAFNRSLNRAVNQGLGRALSW